MFYIIISNKNWYFSFLFFREKTRFLDIDLLALLTNVTLFFNQTKFNFTNIWRIIPKHDITYKYKLFNFCFD